jgi:hypothetical protein
MTFYGSSEEIMHAANRISDAADRIERAAGTIDEACRLLRLQLEPGYGGTGPALLEILQYSAELAKNGLT